MAKERLLDLIPDSLKQQFIDEVKELIEGKDNQTNKAVDPVFTQNKGVDPDIIAFAQNQNKKSKKY